MNGGLCIRTQDGGVVLIDYADQVAEFCGRYIRQWEAGEDADRISIGDGIVTLRADNRTVSYGLVSYDRERDMWTGYRSGD